MKIEMIGYELTNRHPAEMTLQRKRGRPRKRVRSPRNQFIPFRKLPGGVPTKKNVAEVVSWFRNDWAPHDKTGALKAWLDAAADAIEAGDAFRTGYYSIHAMQQFMLCMHEAPIKVHSYDQPPSEHRVVTIHTLMNEGMMKLMADKRKGRRGRWK